MHFNRVGYGWVTHISGRQRERDAAPILDAAAVTNMVATANPEELQNVLRTVHKKLYGFSPPPKAPRSKPPWVLPLLCITVG